MRDEEEGRGSDLWTSMQSQHFQLFSSQDSLDKY